MQGFFILLGVFLILVVPIASFVWQFRRVHRGLDSRFKGIVLYAAYAALPLILYLGIFLALVGVEALLDRAVIGEGYARSLMIVGGGGAALVIVGTIAFSVVVALSPALPKPSQHAQEP